MPSELLPDSVTTLLKSSRFVHLATCLNNIPHVSLMNYTYYRDSNGDYIIITTPQKTTKYNNMVLNPNVSILVHDWVSAKSNTSGEDSTSGRRNSLYEMLTNMNRTEISSVSVMIDGKAEILKSDSEKFNFYKSLHLNNDSIDQVQAKNYIECEDNALVLIRIEGCKITDTENNIQQFQK
ncbi:hypothetical protein CAAN1_02S03994 [[Candida] anglica]|uniref:Pyridoxamine 5'-phosphate oxidase N-terminal domain-containing protein n=1 Tax=[Candida] anglica TaxID=148631 RepID=A0ABP0EF72_9ASCO